MNKNRTYILDCNILLYLYSPIPLSKNNKEIIKYYSNFFEKIISSEQKIMIPSFILSEYINKCLRTDASIKGITNKDYKRKYRNTSLSDDMFKFIKTSIKGLLSIKNISICNDEFDTFDFDIFYSDKTDFNDLLLKNITKKNNYILISHDKDFLKYKDIELIQYSICN